MTTLYNHLSAISKKPRDDTVVFIIVSTYKNGKHQLVLKSDQTYGSLVLSYQKAKEKIPEQEPVFDDNAGFIELSDDEDGPTGSSCLEFEDEKFNQFQFRQVDKFEMIVKRLRTYMQHLTTNKMASLQLTEGKREKKQSGNGGGKKRVMKR